MQKIALKDLSEESLRACSFMIDGNEHGHETENYCAQYGVIYLGEACRLDWHPSRNRTSPAKRISPARERLGELLKGHGLVFGSDPTMQGWRPPYWDDETWISFLSKPLSETSMGRDESAVDRYRFSGLHCVGEVIRSVADKRPIHFRWLQEHIGRADPTCFRAGMIIPSDWQPSGDMRRAETFTSDASCKSAAIGVLLDLIGLNADGLESSADMLATLFRRLGVKKLREAVDELENRLPIVGPGFNSGEGI